MTREAVGRKEGRRDQGKTNENKEGTYREKRWNERRDEQTDRRTGGRVEERTKK